MNRWTRIAAYLTVAAVLPAFHASAAQRTFVASSGSDLNACSLAAPCRSFGTAMAQTDTGGEIIVLDLAGYGRVTIDQSVSIAAPSGVFAGISVFAGTNGIDVAGNGIMEVALRGLSINGEGGLHGITFTQGARLYIEQCVISNMSGRGISLETGDTFITDSTIRDNSSSGIWTQGSLDLVIDRTRIEHNSNRGLFAANGPRVTITNSVIAFNSGFSGVEVDSDDGASQTMVSITDSNVSQNANMGIRAQAANAGTIVRLAVARSTLSGNSLSGVSLNAATGALTAVVTDNTIVRNSTGVAATGAAVSATIANNAVSGNVSGIQQRTSALLKTRNNNVVQDNVVDITGTLTFVGGDQ